MNGHETPLEPASRSRATSIDELPVAPLGKRVSALVLDYVATLVLILVWLVTVVPALIVNAALGVLIGLLALCACVAAANYLTWWREGEAGASIGKSYLGIWVVDARTGSEIGPLRGFIRGVLRIGALTAPFHPRGRGLHDLAVRSIVTGDTPREQSRRYLESRVPIRMQTSTGWATGYAPQDDG